MTRIFKVAIFILLIGLTVELTAAKNSAAEDWYLQSEDKKVYLFIHEVGKGEPIVAIHGGPGAGYRYMTGIAKGLENQFRFVFYDQRGAGLSFTNKDNILMPNNVQDLETIRKAYGVEKISIISHSAGTYLAMEYLRTFPQNVKNIVLVGATDPVNGSKDFFSEEEHALYAKLPEVVKQFNERPEVQAEIKKAGLDQPNLTAKQRYQLLSIRQSAGTLYRIERWRANPFIVIKGEASQGARVGMNFVYNWSKMLSAHPHAITVINGEYDYQVGVKGSPIWKRVIANDAKKVRLVLIDKASHNCWIDEPNIFRNSLREALTR